eukprot:7055873-Lingulodinium_polyedra.AAC.1
MNSPRRTEKDARDGRAKRRPHGPHGARDTESSGRALRNASKRGPQNARMGTHNGPDKNKHGRTGAVFALFQTQIVWAAGS